MKLKFLGAAKTVTGSFFVLETERNRFAVDCGLFQGNKEVKNRNYQGFLVDPKSIDFLILTHAHIDHSGLIPKLSTHGFKGPIYCSHATEELVKVMLPDSGYIQESEVERKNRKLKRAASPLLEPIYTARDAVECLSQFRSLNYDEIISLGEGIEVRLRDAGHILGSCIVELWVEEDGKKMKLVFSGDLGNTNQPIIKDPTIIESADYLILESTYGDRDHKGMTRRREQLKEIIDDTMRKGGNLIIPSFAVERTQDLLFDLHALRKEGQLYPGIDIFIDSPLAIAATQIFQKSIEDYDHETRQMVEAGSHPLTLPNLKYSKTQQDSVQLNNIKGNTIIISASGMCDAGRIKHHLKHNLWRPESTILFIGYQAEGTLGRKILEGQKLVKIHGEEVAVKADIKNIEAYSAHADRTGIMNWLKKFMVKPRTVFLVHGEEQAQLSLAELIKSELNVPVYIPDWQEEVELTPINREGRDEQKISKAIQAEHMYLEYRSQLHKSFREEFEKENYDKIIQLFKDLNSKIG
ncbi:MAG: MBL fold metallo-hydrolase RNA specificity domain-containing protein [Syntrophomonadaceae bacterium]|jgi:metallo-beta-lactamase family protein